MRLHNRQIKATFWTDPDILQWSREKRWFYMGLIQLADDSGCLEDSPFAFKIHLFPSPLDADITPDVLANWRDELIALYKLIPYEANGKKYLFIANFHKHQTLDKPTPPSKASIPLPPWVIWDEVKDEKGKVSRRQSQYKVLESELEKYLRTIAGQWPDNGRTNTGRVPVELEPEPELELELKNINTPLLSPQKDYNKARGNEEHSRDDQRQKRRSIRSDQCSSVAPKKQFAEFVFMTEDEYSKLVQELGDEKRAKRCIEILDNYKGASGKKYKSDYRAIRTWVISKLEEEERRRVRNKEDPRMWMERV